MRSNRCRQHTALQSEVQRAMLELDGYGSSFFLKPARFSQSRENFRHRVSKRQFFMKVELQGFLISAIYRFILFVLIAQKLLLPFDLHSLTAFFSLPYHQQRQLQSHKVISHNGEQVIQNLQSQRLFASYDSIRPFKSDLQMNRMIETDQYSSNSLHKSRLIILVSGEKLYNQKSNKNHRSENTGINNVKVVKLAICFGERLFTGNDRLTFSKSFSTTLNTIDSLPAPCINRNGLKLI